MGGFLADAAILGVLSWGLLGPETLLALTGGDAAGLMLPWILLVPVAYAAGWIASPASATPGQVLFGLAVRSEADGGRPTPAQALAAALFGAFSWATGGVAFLAPLFSSRARALHDLFSGTVVVRAEAAPSVAPWTAGTLADG
jgi:uncharacterized RDD family membrane protein YckC